MAQEEATNVGSEKNLNQGNLIPTVVFDLVTVLGVEAPKADEVVKFYKNVFGAVVVEQFSTPKRKANLGQPHLQVLLLFGSTKVLVVDQFEHELKAQQNCTFRVVTVGDAEAVVNKVVAAEVTDDVVVNEYAFIGRQCRVMDKFGVVWIFKANKEKPADDSENAFDITLAGETAVNNSNEVIEV